MVNEENERNEKNDDRTMEHWINGTTVGTMMKIESRELMTGEKSKVLGGRIKHRCVQSLCCRTQVPYIFQTRFQWRNYRIESISNTR